MPKISNEDLCLPAPSETENARLNPYIRINTCLLNNNCLVGGTTDTERRLTPTQKKSAESLRLECNSLVDSVGIDRLLFITLTFSDPLPDRGSRETLYDHFKKLILLRLNPMLECMPRTEWNQLHHIWIRIEGWRPSSAFCENSMWVPSGLVPVLDMPPGSQEFTRTAGPTSKQQTIIPFESINWLKTSRNLFLRQRVECKHGPLLLPKENNRHELNYRTAAEFIVVSSQLAYHSVQDTFTANPHKQPEPDQLSVERVRQSIMDFLHNVSVNHPTQFPANRVSRRTTNILLELLKSVCGTEPITEKTSLRDYVRTRLVRQAGATVTTEELYLDYLRHCNQLKFPPPLVPRRHFLTLMPKIMQEELGVLKSHCVPRSGATGNAATARNGFFGTAYRKEQDGQDHKDGQDV